MTTDNNSTDETRDDLRERYELALQLHDAECQCGDYRPERDEPDDPLYIGTAAAVLGSAWLAGRLAAVRADERTRIATELEAAALAITPGEHSRGGGQ